MYDKKISHIDMQNKNLPPNKGQHHNTLHGAPMKRIAFFLSDFSTKGGEQKINAKLANGLAKNEDYKISLVSLFLRKKELSFSLDSRIEFKTVFDEKPFDMRLNFIKSILGLRSFFKRNKFDLVISSAAPLFLTFAIPQEVKKIYWTHQSFFFGRKFGLEWLGRRIAAKRWNVIVTLLEKTKNDFLRNLNCKAKIQTVSNSISALEKSVAYNSESKSIVSVGRCSLQKGFDILIDVAKIVLNKHKDWEWHVGGDGSQMPNLIKKRDMCGLKGRLFFDGIPADINSYYNNRAIYVMTSRHEGFPIVLLEAQRAKLPCVAFDCLTGPSEIITDGENGYIVKPFDIELMASRICALIEDPKLRIKFSENSQKDFKKYSDDIFFERWNDIISETLSER